MTDGTGYVLVCLPWLSKFEWHAFSLFSHPTKPHHSCVCMAVGGDWTRRLHEVVQRPTRRPVWISGPFASPYATAAEYDNLVLVASGIGITPAMSIITTYRDTRRVNLIWACRDASLLEFYLDKCTFDDQGWTLIYYTGKRKLHLPHALAPTVLIFHGRPNLLRTIRQIIGGVETAEGLPEDLLQASNDFEAAAADELTAASRLRDDSGIPLDAVPVPTRFTLLIRRCLVSMGEDELAAQIAAQFAPQSLTMLSDAEVHAAAEQFFKPVLEEGEHAFALSEAAELTALFRSGAAAPNPPGAVCVAADITRACMGALDAEMYRDDLERRSSGSELAGEGGGEGGSPVPAAPNRRSSAEDKRTEAEQVFRIATRGKAASGGQPAPHADDFVQQIGAARLATWQMLYCGGSQPVVEALKDVERKYGVGLRVEKFDW